MKYLPTGETQPFRAFAFNRSDSDVLYLKTNVVASKVNVFYSGDRSLILKVTEDGTLYSLEVVGVECVHQQEIELPQTREGHCPGFVFEKQHEVLPEPKFALDPNVKSIEIQLSDEPPAEYLAFDDALLVAIGRDSKVCKLWLINLVDECNMAAVREEHLL